MVISLHFLTRAAPHNGERRFNCTSFGRGEGDWSNTNCPWFSCLMEADEKISMPDDLNQAEGVIYENKNRKSTTHQSS